MEVLKTDHPLHVEVFDYITGKFHELGAEILPEVLKPCVWSTDFCIDFDDLFRPPVVHAVFSTLRMCKSSMFYRPV